MSLGDKGLEMVQNMTLVKICGLKRMEDIMYVNRYLPQYVGFVFAESKRRVTSEQVKGLRQKLDPAIKAVGVFVNEAVERIIEIVEECSLDCIQLHGDETVKYVDTLREALKWHPSGPGVEIWKAIRVRDESYVNLLNLYKADVFLLDAFVEGAYGGAGKAFDLKLASLAKDFHKIFIAGGMNLVNVADVVKAARPYGIDVSSGVETEGFKDELKIKQFIDEIVKTDKEMLR